MGDTVRRPCSETHLPRDVPPASQARRQVRPRYRTPATRAVEPGSGNLELATQPARLAAAELDPVAASSLARVRRFVGSNYRTSLLTPPSTSPAPRGLDGRPRAPARARSAHRDHARATALMPTACSRTDVRSDCCPHQRRAIRLRNTSSSIMPSSTILPQGRRGLRRGLSAARRRQAPSTRSCASRRTPSAHAPRGLKRLEPPDRPLPRLRFRRPSPPTHDT